MVLKTTHYVFIYDFWKWPRKNLFSNLIGAIPSLPNLFYASAIKIYVIQPKTTSFKIEFILFKPNAISYKICLGKILPPFLSHCRVKPRNMCKLYPLTPFHLNNICNCYMPPSLQSVGTFVNTAACSVAQIEHTDWKLKSVISRPDWLVDTQSTHFFLGVPLTLLYNVYIITSHPKKVIGKKSDFLLQIFQDQIFFSVLVAYLRKNYS